MVSEELANELWTEACEAEGGINHVLQTAVNTIEEVYGPIENGSVLEELVLAAIQFGIDNADN